MIKRLINKIKSFWVIKSLSQSSYFSEQWYKDNYSAQLEHYHKSAITHYLTIGWKNGNDPSPLFSTNAYLVAYPDVTSSGMCPLLHYVANGKHEGRQAFAIKTFDYSSTQDSSLPIYDDVEFVACKQQPYENNAKVGIVCHVYYLDLFPQILDYVNQLTIGYSLYITTNNENKDAVEALVNRKIENYKITVVENKGYDLLPFIDMLPTLVQDGIEYVCKLHTKKGAANLEAYYEGIETVWSDLLIKPLISSNKVVNDIVASLEADEQLGFVTSASVFKSAKQLMYGNEVMVSNILGAISPRIDPAQEWGFAAGSMFWSRLDVLLPLLQLEIKDSPSVNKTGSVASYWHALERVLGLLPIISNKTVALSFITDKENTKYCVGKLGSNYKKYINGYGVGLTLATEHALVSNYDVLSRSFPEINTEDNTLDPILYYLRYGVFLGNELTPNFNSAAYWHFYSDVLNARLNPLVHYVVHGEAKGRIAFPAENNVAKNIEIIAASGLFDELFYNQENPDVFNGNSVAIEHFCVYGWKELRDPCATIDISYLGAATLTSNNTIINPLIYKLLTNAELPKTDYTALADSGVSYNGNNNDNNSGSTAKRVCKRICLFAGYDKEGVIDQSVIDYVKELSLHADVYYLADANIAESELAKLANYTVKSWAFRHGEYDFGSYARLANNLVGWQQIEKYDELVLANDSCYLIDSLAAVFDKMHQKKTDWWGMQATKGISKTKDKLSNLFNKKQALDHIKRTKLADFEQESFYDFLVGSYFLCFRQSVIAGGELKQLLTSVKKQRNKLNIIRQYEIGLTRTLINAGYNFDTFIDDLYPFHPIYTNNHFELIEQGLPLFKRFFLTENHYHVPQLWRWQEKLTALKPALNLTPLTDNLYRVASDEKLFRNFNISLDEAGQWHYPKLLTDEEFAEQDLLIEKDPKQWCFPVCAYDNNLSGNDRAVFEQVKNDPSIKKIILTRANKLIFDGENIEVYPLHSLEGQQALLRSKVIFIKHSPMVNTPFPLDSTKHHFINLWHGIPLKQIGCASLDLQHILPELKEENTRNTAVVCSSDIDKLAMASAFSPLALDKMWLTGLPRIDFILKNEAYLPDDFKAELAYVKSKVNGRKLVFFCPTFKNGQEAAYYQFSQQEKTILKQWLSDNGYVLGIREHMADNANSYYGNLMDLDVIDLSAYKIKNIEVIYRVADLLITDYSSCFIDFMVTGKPVISFAYDYDSYINEERGLFYDLAFAVPGEVCKTFAELTSALDNVVEGGNPVLQQFDYEQTRAVFFKYLDADNSTRLVNRILTLLEPEETT